MNVRIDVIIESFVNGLNIVYDPQSQVLLKNNKIILDKFFEIEN